MKTILNKVQKRADKLVLVCMFAASAAILCNFPRIIVYAVTGN